MCTVKENTALYAVGKARREDACGRIYRIMKPIDVSNDDMIHSLVNVVAWYFEPYTKLAYLPTKRILKEVPQKMMDDPNKHVSAHLLHKLLINTSSVGTSIKVGKYVTPTYPDGANDHLDIVPCMLPKTKLFWSTIHPIFVPVETRKTIQYFINMQALTKYEEIPWLSKSKEKQFHRDMHSQIKNSIQILKHNPHEQYFINKDCVDCPSTVEDVQNIATRLLYCFTEPKQAIKNFKEDIKNVQDY